MNFARSNDSPVAHRSIDGKPSHAESHELINQQLTLSLNPRVSVCLYFMDSSFSQSVNWSNHIFKKKKKSSWYKSEWKNKTSVYCIFMKRRAVHNVTCTFVAFCLSLIFSSSMIIFVYLNISNKITRPLTPYQHRTTAIFKPDIERNVKHAVSLAK